MTRRIHICSTIIIVVVVTITSLSLYIDYYEKQMETVRDDFIDCIIEADFERFDYYMRDDTDFPQNMKYYCDLRNQVKEELETLEMNQEDYDYIECFESINPRIMHFAFQFKGTNSSNQEYEITYNITMKREGNEYICTRASIRNSRNPMKLLNGKILNPE